MDARPAASGPSLLLVCAEGAAAAAEDALRAAAPGASVTPCTSAEAARLFVAAAAFDAVYVDPSVPDAAAVAAALGEVLPAFVRGAPGAGDESASGDGAAGPGGDLRVSDSAALDDIRRELGRAVHAANNPLTVIAGNAQYLLEMAHAMDLDPALVRSLEDIETAARQLQAALADLAAARQRLASALPTPDEIG